MTIPDYQTLLRPALVVLTDGRTRTMREMREQLAGEYNLTDEERAEFLPSGKVRTFDSRVGWALTYLFQAGLTERPSRGSVRIADAGRAFLSTHPVSISTQNLQEIGQFQDFQARGRDQPRSKNDLTASGDDDAGNHELDDHDSVSTPNELLERAVSANRATVVTDLLDRLQSVTPYEFERIVLDLLSAMGYGQSGSIERTSASGDAGVDGIISQDPLGLDRIYVQAKRYADHRTIQRPAIQEFAGALQYRQGDRGVFITTSSFTKGAAEAAERISARIELIDGIRLAGLLVDHGVGVQEEQTVTLYRIDEDYFELP
ncbi:restriction endonuclease [Rhodococcus sp. 14-2470-1a]|uniref:restriction endonuclease n=1 Tax=Rhodococcus sp. 14-2470-1a TaxID=2023150 RepID=UPI000B9BB492|nr:restriction endonuclease [Rhodococcus sp. 14-2470-1a]OZF50452.1 restriction endonuclease [Rhodococcus sp. 14-2470-1a]